MPSINELGNRYGKLTVVKKVEGLRNSRWICRCDCGNEIEISGRNLRLGKAQSCGCDGFGYMIGRKFGRLTVLKSVGLTYDKVEKWLCECECGNTTIVRTNNLISGNTKSCGCLFLETRQSKDIEKSTFNELYGRIRYIAKVRGNEFDLTRDQVREITSSKCHYCGVEPSQIHKRKGINGTSMYIYNGIDRKNNNLGYVIDNVVPCCKICNYAKNTMNYKEFLEWVSTVHKHLSLSD